MLLYVYKHTKPPNSWTCSMYSTRYVRYDTALTWPDSRCPSTPDWWSYCWFQTWPPLPALSTGKGCQGTKRNKGKKYVQWTCSSWQTMFWKHAEIWFWDTSILDSSHISTSMVGGFSSQSLQDKACNDKKQPVFTSKLYMYLTNCIINTWSLTLSLFLSLWPDCTVWQLCSSLPWPPSVQLPWWCLEFLFFHWRFPATHHTP